MRSVKKVFFCVFLLVLLLGLSSVCHAAQGSYTVDCQHCSGGYTVTYVQEYGTCTNCGGDCYIRSSSSGKLCFSCGSRNVIYVPAYTGNAHYECNSCGSGRVLNGYVCGACDGEGRCYRTVAKDVRCQYCNGTGSISVDCQNHSYGSWSDLGGGSHSRTCSRCKYVETTNHTWNSGAVIKVATCKENGEKAYTCTGCGATKTETVAKKSTHNYGSWVKADDASHIHICSVCAKKETANHDWNSGEVTKAATHTEEGIKTYTCLSCSATKTESIAKLVGNGTGNQSNMDSAGQQTGSQNNTDSGGQHNGNQYTSGNWFIYIMMAVAVVLFTSICIGITVQRNKEQ